MKRTRPAGWGRGLIANGLTVSRMPLSLLLFGFPPSSRSFMLLYLLCGATDVLDGFTARKLHTESSAGERLDSLADLFFAAAYAVKILPFLCLPRWLRIWTAGIAVGKLLGVVSACKRERKVGIAHSFANRLTGLLVFLLPMTMQFAPIPHSAAVVCAAATLAAAGDFPARRRKNSAKQQRIPIRNQKETRRARQ